MKRIGLIGGLSWQSTVDYYRIINEESAKRLGGLNNVESIVYSVNLNEMLEHMGKGEVEILGGKFAAVGKKLEEAGAEETAASLRGGIIVTERGIDEHIRRLAKLTALGVNLALQSALDVEDVAAFFT